ncbi:plastid division protein PDV1 [Rutidosis leptorrhynchoides]|uniref:plastid division protein PDV1 n=1 Tax=Rutidosis leptorrhynchoides TaxID=125765 RepID=UPI003A99CA9B
MKWEMDMEMEEVEAVLEKIWDLHDKLSDAIHSISRSHFLHSVKSLRTTHSNDLFDRKKLSDADVKGGFVYVKDFPMEQDDDSAIHEAKSLNSIRTALENLEDQLEFFHTVQTQQRAERDAAIARLEQSRIVLALRLADHHGKKYKVIEEARAFVGEVQNHSKYVPPENGYTPEESYGVGKRSNILFKLVISSFNFAKKSLKVEHLGGVLGNAALFAVSMLALLHLHQVADRDRYISDLQHIHEVNNSLNKNVTKVYLPEGGSSNGLDVLSARG